MRNSQGTAIKPGNYIGMRNSRDTEIKTGTYLGMRNSRDTAIRTGTYVGTRKSQDTTIRPGTHTGTKNSRDTAIRPGTHTGMKNTQDTAIRPGIYTGMKNSRDREPKGATESPRTKTPSINQQHNETKNKPKRNSRSQRKKSLKEIRVLYCNANGIRGKIKSIETAATTHGAHVITIAETKGPAPTISGYSSWYTKDRCDTRGGGVAIAVREDIINKCQPLDNMEDHNQEIKWIQINTHQNKKLSIGVYYGKQENEKIENVEREFSQLRTQILKIKESGPLILTGDFNAKVKVEKNGELKQETSRNGAFLEELLNDLELTPISTKSETGTWTRVNRNNTRERSIIDYMIIRKSDEEQISENIIDEVGAMRIKGSKETDHNTLMLSFKCPLAKSSRVVKKWKLNNSEGWTEYNNRMAKIPVEITRDYEAFEKELNKILEETVGSVNIRLGKK